MPEKQPPHSTEHNGSEDQEKFHTTWNSSELPANTPVTISAEHTTSDELDILLGELTENIEALE